jgi:hypothetical protein
MSISTSSEEKEKGKGGWLGTKCGKYLKLLVRQIQLPGAFFILVTCIIGIGGCRSTKKIEKAIAAKKDTTHYYKIDTNAAVAVNPREDSLHFIQYLFGRIAQNRIHFRTFSAKLKVNYEGSDGRGYEFTAFMRMLTDSLIWVRGDAILGIEAFRVLISPDSVKILDKMGKTVTLRSVSYLQEVAKLPINFKTLQDLLIGNPIFLDSTDAFYSTEDAGISLITIGDLFKNYLTLNKMDYSLKHAKLDDVDPMRARTCDLTYRDYEWRDSIHFSTYRKISLAEKSKLDIELSFKQYNFNEVLSFPFPIPKNYKRK